MNSGTPASSPAGAQASSPAAAGRRRASRRDGGAPRWRELALLARMAGWTIIISVAARFLPLPKALGIMTPRRRASASLPPARIARLASLVTRNCWKRAALLHRYLLLAGVDNRVVFGVRRTGQSPLDGHAWIEVDGQPFPEPAPPDYHVTFVYP